jgi:hypothetical protein
VGRPLPSWEEAHRAHIPTLIHPPAKEDFGRLLTNLLRDSNLRPEDETARLLLFIVARCVLPAEKPTSDQSNAEIIKSRIRRWENGEFGELWHKAITAKEKRERG